MMPILEKMFENSKRKLDNKYTEWINKNVPEHTLGKCVEITQSMAASFPELTRVRGHYFDPIWGEDRAHWWLVAEDGTIVDPTASQFPSGGIAECYEQWEEGREEPTGLCMICGEYTYNGRYTCSRNCEIELNCEYNIQS